MRKNEKKTKKKKKQRKIRKNLSYLHTNINKKNFLRIEEIDDAMDTLGLEKDSATYATLVDAYIAVIPHLLSNKK